ncbi:hypothetical protein [Tychonema sp. BBK16]|nr:hypothetical protein [Tychonema sp. BBK16]MCF6372499.1 hypothetical protein [Tychonema sp. BBK16]
MYRYTEFGTGGWALLGVGVELCQDSTQKRPNAELARFYLAYRVVLHAR